MRWLRWFFKGLLWLLLEWWEAVVSGILASLGADLIFGLNVVFGSQWEERSPEIFVKFGPALLYSTALILLGRWVYRRFFSYHALKGQLERALTNLGSDNIHLRIHAISDILEISRKSRKLHVRAIESLANYVRQHSPSQDILGRNATIKKERFGPPNVELSETRESDYHKFAQAESKIERRTVADDIRAALEAIAYRRRFFDDPRRWIDLSLCDLPSANLEGAKLGQISFAGSCLRHARFDNAKLRRASFAGAVVTDAQFDGADLREASFASSRGHRLHLDGTRLKGASFMGADIYDACIQKTDARSVEFMGANMWRLDGGLTDFTGSSFFRADIRGASLYHAKGLTREQVLGRHGSGAITDKNTRLPWSTEEELRASGMSVGRREQKDGTG